MQGTSFPGVCEIEHAWIALSDGCHLAARLWIPEDAEHQPAPAVLEYIPYRKRDETVSRDHALHGDLATRGIACVRVDLRGSGDSEGVLLDEYLPREQQDAVEVIEWIAAQPWCNGAVGMMGISWGGFAALQVAALRPEPLKAIVTVCSTDDRYANDIHFKGGCLLNDNLSWGTTMMAYCSRPPDPAVAGERWRTMWRERIEDMAFFPGIWLSHPTRDEYWRHGSVCETPDAIRARILAIGGWADPYVEAIPRLLREQHAPREAIIGPWGHKYPHEGEPGPAIDFAGVIERWWHESLVPNAFVTATHPPRLTAFLRESPLTAGPSPSVSGRWIQCHDAAAQTGPRRMLHPDSAGRLRWEERAGNRRPRTICSRQDIGTAAGYFCPYYARGGDMPVDQRSDDAGSLLFDSAPLKAPFEILGQPVLELALSVDRPVAHVTVRLCDVAPDGASTRVSFGCLNLCHRNSHERPQFLEPHKGYRVQVRLHDVGWSFRPGHCLRVAISTAYWPLLWPPPEPVTLTTHPSESRLLLPEWRPGENDIDPVQFASPAQSPSPQVEQLTPSAPTRTVEHDHLRRETVVRREDHDGGLHFPEHGLCARTMETEVHRIDPEDPLSARADIAWTCSYWRGDSFYARIDTRTHMHADSESFYLTGEVVGYENEMESIRREFQQTLPRRWN